jgi:hypothetical protein
MKNCKSSKEWLTKEMSNQSSFLFHLLIYTMVTWNVRICIGFKVTFAACNDDISSEKE